MAKYIRWRAGRNPCLRRFVEEQGRPYDPLNDSYVREPFDKSIETSKATAIYSMHAYWSKKPHDAIGEYIQHYTERGDLILDPFCGSGGTILMAIATGRKGIAIDLSPVATFITRYYCLPPEPQKLRSAYRKLVEKVTPEINWLYETRCERCGGKAITAYTVYSSVFRCKRCFNDIPLYDCPTKKVMDERGRMKKMRVCPVCYGNGQIEVISARTHEKVGVLPVEVNYICQNGCKPARSTRQYNDTDPEKERYFREYDLRKVEEIEGVEIPHWYPRNRMMNSPEGQEKWGVLWRAGTANFEYVYEFFTRRNLWALSALFEAAGSDDDLKFIVNSAVMALSRKSQHLKEGGGYIPGHYYIPQVMKERNALLSLSRIASRIFKGIEELRCLLGEGEPAVLISTQSACDLSDIPDNSIDYIFTDPPYGRNVQYGELNFIWESFLRFDSSWLDEELTINEVRGKTEEDWKEGMKRAFSECFRVLKPGRWLSLCYHDSSTGTWGIVQDIMREIGFIPDSLHHPLYIDAKQKSFNKYNGETPVKRDLIINFCKPRASEPRMTMTIRNNISDEGYDEGYTEKGAGGEGDAPGGNGDDGTPTLSIRQKVKAILVRSLRASPGQTMDRLYDEVVSDLVRRGEFEPHDFRKILEEVAEERDSPQQERKFSDARESHWYLKEGVD